MPNWCTNSIELGHKDPEVLKSMTEIMNKHGIPINDLFAAAEDRPEYFSKDGTHHNAKGKSVQASLVSAAVRKALAK